MNEIYKLAADYSKWLAESIDCSPVYRSDWVEVETPYLDRYNKQIRIYCKGTDTGYLLTDDGFTLDEALEGEGYSPTTETTIQNILRCFGAKIVGAEIQIDVPDPDNFPLRMHNLIQAILAVNWGIGWANR